MPDRERRSLIFAHQEWIGFVQPVGLVVAPSVMVDAQVAPDRNVSGRQRDFRELLEEDGSSVTARWRAPDLRRLFLDYLGWEEGDLVDAAEHRDALEISLPELQVVLSPTWAVPAEDEAEADRLMLVHVEQDGIDFDAPPDDTDAWNASRHARFERLLRETNVPIGLLCTDDRIRLIYAPKGETSGHITFDFSEMALPAGRPILAAFDMLLSADALFVGAEEARLPSLLAKSREAQAEVSTRLARQVLGALYELLRGFVAADARNGDGTLLTLARQQPDHLYGGLITALMRLVFVLYTEDRGLMPDHPVYQQHYSLGGLFARLRADAAAYPDTMDQRFGAWAQLLSLFRLIHNGGSHAGLSFVARKGRLFDPDCFPFLEGRRKEDEPEIPMVPDATVWNVLQNLMMLNGERLSYRTLDVEQIGSVYEAIMGFRVEQTEGRSIAVRSKKRTGAAVVVDLEALLGTSTDKRVKALRDATDQALTGSAAQALRAAETPEDIIATLDRKVDRAATPDIIPGGTPVLQPTDERRRSGSHYTPRSLTEPIVSEALRPVFERLGPAARPDEILDLKILDPAMGSGAFLVEACRQVAAKLVDAWDAHGGLPTIPADEDELLHARRLVAQRCLYGIDKNPMAVDLARLSLWLATLARDHEFTFVDHALRHGNFLVGLTMDQIAAANWEADGTHHMAVRLARERTRNAEAERARIRAAADGVSEEELRALLDRADRHLDHVRLVGDATIAAFFTGQNARAREADRAKVLEVLDFGKSDWQGKLRGAVTRLRSSQYPVDPFHFEIEFPEVFDRQNPGFDAVVGNPPFAGKNSIITSNQAGFLDWLKTIHYGAHGNADLVAHFFRRAFLLLRQNGAMGLIATNTIRQGDTRSTGLRWIRVHGGEIYAARRRIRWPGQAAVVVSTVHIAKGEAPYPRTLDGQGVERLTAYLFHFGGDEDPDTLVSNAKQAFKGSEIGSLGFLVSQDDPEFSEFSKLADPRSASLPLLKPYIGGEDLNRTAEGMSKRYVLDVDVLDEQQMQAFPQVYQFLRQRVRPDFLRRGEIEEDTSEWWHFRRPSLELRKAMNSLPRILATSRVSNTCAFTFIRNDVIANSDVICFHFASYSAFSLLQSRIHEIWSRFFSSSMKDDLRYAPSDCFETFPFPGHFEIAPALQDVGERCYKFRADLMVQNDEGLTKTYNRFHFPDERSNAIAELRNLHDQMDWAVLAAYGWDDIKPVCQFELEWEDEDEESSSRRRKPWRYRWPEEARDEVLARLLALNAERGREEQLAGGDAQLLLEPAEVQI